MLRFVVAEAPSAMVGGQKGYPMKKNSPKINAGELCQVLFLLSVCVLIILFLVSGNRHAVQGTVFWAGIIGLLLAVRPGSSIHKVTMEDGRPAYRRAIVLVMALVILVCVCPMDESPLWNGQVPGHRNQYELMADALLDGRLHLEYGDEEALRALENPYDPQARSDSGVSYHWDHAWYNGHYYMYFGIVPVLLVFLPYRILTGTSLTTFHATRLFIALTIVGIFQLLRLLAKRFFKELPLCTYLAMAAAFSVVSIWFSIAQPALYCTAIAAGLCLEIWSLFFFARAVWVKQEESAQLINAAVGALLGALVFGCRPTIGLGNILVLPMLLVFLEKRELTPALAGKLVLAALPYALVAAGLMLYNYARFDNPFEFGQTYQLTVADQTSLGDLSQISVRLRLINESYENFFGLSHLTDKFPYVQHSGVFVNFPILLLVFGLFRKEYREQLQKIGLLPFAVCLFLLPILITLAAILWSPYLLERYRMDIYFLICILGFLLACVRYRQAPGANKASVSSFLMTLSIVTLLSCFALHLVSVRTFLPEKLEKIEHILMFWKYL